MISVSKRIKSFAKFYFQKYSTTKVLFIFVKSYAKFYEIVKFLLYLLSDYIFEAYTNYEAYTNMLKLNIFLNSL